MHLSADQPASVNCRSAVELAAGCPFSDLHSVAVEPAWKPVQHLRRRFLGTRLLVLAIVRRLELNRTDHYEFITRLKFTYEPSKVLVTAFDRHRHINTGEKTVRNLSRPFSVVCLRLPLFFTAIDGFERLIVRTRRVYQAISGDQAVQMTWNGITAHRCRTQICAFKLLFAAEQRWRPVTGCS